MLLDQLKSWKNLGDYLVLDDKHKVFFIDFGDKNASADKTLLLLHGFPESSFSYHKVVGILKFQFERVIVFDFIGFGLSDKPTKNFNYSIFEHAATALKVWKQLNVKGGHLLAHDMGSSVLTELVAMQLEQKLPSFFNAGFKSLTITDGNLVLKFAQLRITQKLLLSKIGFLFSKLSHYKLFRHQVKSAHGNDNLSEKDLEMLWNNATQNKGHKINHLLIKYYKDRVKNEKSRWLPALSKTKIPIHICWGNDDAVANINVANFLKNEVCQNAKLSIMENTGHFCQLGNNAVWLLSVSEFYKNWFVENGILRLEEVE